MSRVTVTAPTSTRSGNDWRHQAECRDEDPELFFPHPGDTVRAEAAKAICARCPVWDECLTWATEQHEEGVWGGTTEDERRPRRSRRKRNGPVPTAQCGSESGARRHRKFKQRVCALCRDAEKRARDRRQLRSGAEAAA